MELPKKIKCLVVDDEPIARKIIKNYIEQIAFLEFDCECKNGIETMEILDKREDIQLVFLDINMPNINGLSIAKILKNKVLLIFTTAYSEFAVDSYEVNAVDYLLKPFSFERFATAVFKASDKINNSIENFNEKLIDPILNNKTIFIKSEGRSYPVTIESILYCEAMKNYTKVVLFDGKILKTLIGFSKIENELRAHNLDILRVHRSFLIAKSHISSVNKNFVFIDKYQIPIGQNYKESVLEKIGLKL